MKGAKPKPSHLKMIAGNPGKRQLPEDEPIPEGDLIDPPSFLSERQKAVWVEGLSNCPKGLLKKLDSSVYLTWVLACDVQQQAAEDIGKLGIFSYAEGCENERVASEATRIMDKQAMIIIKAAAEMGFTPSSRSRVRVSQPKKKNAFLDD